jgi:hypothetical protein
VTAHNRPVAAVQRLRYITMTRTHRFIVFAGGTLLLGIAWFFGVFLILGANHVDVVSPVQSARLAWLLWWALLAPAAVVLLTLGLVLYEDLGPQRPRRLLWYHLLPLLGTCFVAVTTWSGAWFITLGG